MKSSYEYESRWLTNNPSTASLSGQQLSNSTVRKEGPSPLNHHIKLRTVYRLTDSGEHHLKRTPSESSTPRAVQSGSTEEIFNKTQPVFQNLRASNISSAKGEAVRIHGLQSQSGCYRQIDYGEPPCSPPQSREFLGAVKMSKHGYALLSDTKSIKSISCETTKASYMEEDSYHRIQNHTNLMRCSDFLQPDPDASMHGGPRQDSNLDAVLKGLESELAKAKESLESERTLYNSRMRSLTQQRDLLKQSLFNIQSKDRKINQQVRDLSNKLALKNIECEQLNKEINDRVEAANKNLIAEKEGLATKVEVLKRENSDWEKTVLHYKKRFDEVEAARIRSEHTLGQQVTALKYQKQQLEKKIRDQLQRQHSTQTQTLKDQVSKHYQNSIRHEYEANQVRSQLKLEQTKYKNLEDRLARAEAARKEMEATKNKAIQDQGRILGEKCRQLNNVALEKAKLHVNHQQALSELQALKKLKLQQKPHCLQKETTKTSAVCQTDTTKQVCEKCEVQKRQDKKNLEQQIQDLKATVKNLQDKAKNRVDTQQEVKQDASLRKELRKKQQVLEKVELSLRQHEKMLAESNEQAIKLGLSVLNKKYSNQYCFC